MHVKLNEQEITSSQNSIQKVVIEYLPNTTASCISNRIYWYNKVISVNYSVHINSHLACFI